MGILKKIGRIRIETLNRRDLDEMAQVIAEAFSQDEPMSRQLKISTDELTNFVTAYGLGAAVENLTVVARDEETYQIIGAMFTDDLMASPPQDLQDISRKFSPVMSLLDGLDMRYKEGKKIQAGECLHLFMLAVDRNSGGEKIATHLVDSCLKNGIENGYRTAVTEATGRISQHIFRKLGFRPLLEAPYKSFEQKTPTAILPRSGGG